MSVIQFAYASLSDVLADAGSPLSLGEFHGGLCGVICAGGRDSARQWLEDRVEECDASADRIAALDAELEALESWSWESLSGSALEFEPLLPPDDEALEPRVEALARWCHGFLGGLAVGGYHPAAPDRADGSEIGEIVHDFAAISRAGVDSAALDDPEQAETHFVELSEYVRVSVQIVFETLSDPGATGRQTIH